MVLTRSRLGEPKQHIHCIDDNNKTKYGSENVTSYDETYSSNWDDTDSSYDSNDDYPIAWWELDDISFSLGEPLQKLREDFNDERRKHRWKLDRPISHGVVKPRIILDIESHASIVKERAPSYLKGRNPFYVKVKGTKNAHASLDSVGNEKGRHSTSFCPDRRHHVNARSKNTKDSKKTLYSDIPTSSIKAKEKFQRPHP